CTPGPGSAPPKGDGSGSTSRSAPTSAGAGRAEPPAEVDLSRVRTIPIERRPNKVAAAEFASPPPADRRERSFGAFLKSLPDVLVARDFLRVVNAIASAAKKKKGVVAMCGGRIVKTGLAPLLLGLMKRGVITHLA